MIEIVHMPDIMLPQRLSMLARTIGNEEIPPLRMKTETLTEMVTMITFHLLVLNYIGGLIFRNYISSYET